MLKSVVVLNDVILNVGEWDYQYINVVTNQEEIDEALIHNAENEVLVEIPEPIMERVVTNPLPDGAYETEMDIEFFGDKYGWREASFSPPLDLTLEERVLHTERAINMILLGGI